MSIVMTGGGTGGHLAIVRAVKEQLAPRKAALIYIGSTRGQDRQWFEKDAAFEATYFLETMGVVNQRGLGKIASLRKLFSAFLIARKRLREHRASVVFSVGGFSAAPTALAAKSLGIPLVIHEQNAALGSLNKLLRPVADTFISSYDARSPIRAYPIKQVFFDRARVRERVETVIFLGGSQGAQAINTLALDLAPILQARGIRIIHQAGERNIDSTRQAYEALGIEAEVFGFTDRLAEYMTQADFAIARAGASTLWELSANGLPTLFIPYPYAASDHQYHNARFLVERDLAWLMREEQIDRDAVVALLESDLASMSRGLIEQVERDGAERIADMLWGYASENVL
jgi:UDP-N-acetylglucosamine--N-acetylmuramyl-(pentapeptide) pyrophosphoryl-undecaprenol N-acetylglucosamine transferase